MTLAPKPLQDGWQWRTASAAWRMARNAPVAFAGAMLLIPGLAFLWPAASKLLAVIYMFVSFCLATRSSGGGIVHRLPVLWMLVAALILNHIFFSVLGTPTPSIAEYDGYTLFITECICLVIWLDMMERVFVVVRLLALGRDPADSCEFLAPFIYADRRVSWGLACRLGGRARHMNITPFRFVFIAHIVGLICGLLVVLLPLVQAWCFAIYEEIFYGPRLVQEQKRAGVEVGKVADSPI
jgi:hypothetical protein